MRTEYVVTVARDPHCNNVVAFSYLGAHAFGTGDQRALEHVCMHSHSPATRSNLVLSTTSVVSPNCGRIY
eukprot:m.1143575 g.1143575  ORF g.1143575 m.1143575 type:complete len:70 (-) comp24458_c1_seq2:117-326(-)